MEKNRIKVRIPSTLTQYKVNLIEEGDSKFLKRFQTTELWMVEAEIKNDSTTEAKLKAFKAKDVLKIVFQPVTKEHIEKNKKIAYALKGTRFPETNYYFGTINETLIVFPQNDLAYQPQRRLLNTNTKLVETFELKEISIEELKEKRNTDIPGFVYKEKQKYYYTKINPRIRFVSECFWGYHMCSYGSKDCKRLSAAPDHEGGCARIRDINPCIETYDFISKGFQTFNTKANCFVILSCGQFCPCESRKPVSPQKRRDIIKSLADFYYDDSPSFEDIRKRKAEARRYIP